MTTIVTCCRCNAQLAAPDGHECRSDSRIAAALERIEAKLGAKEPTSEDWETRAGIEAARAKSNEMASLSWKSAYHEAERRQEHYRSECEKIGALLQREASEVCGARSRAEKAERERDGWKKTAEAEHETLRRCELSLSERVRERDAAIQDLFREGQQRDKLAEALRMVLLDFSGVSAILQSVKEARKLIAELEANP